MASIRLRRSGGQFYLVAEDGHATISVALDPADAEAFGIVLLGKNPPPDPRPLLEREPILSWHNPEIEVRKSDSGQIIIVLAGETLPYQIIFDPDAFKRFVIHAMQAALGQ